jgi:hypothetical protein
MSHTRNTRLIHELHEAWARENGYRPKAASSKRQAKDASTKQKMQASSVKRQALTIQKSQAN